MTGALLGLMGGLALAAPADKGREIYINGVRADRVVGVEMQGVNLRFDEKGNLWIDAPNHRVEVEDAGPSQPAAAVPAARYWLVTDDQDSSGHTIDVVVNGVLVRKIRSGEPQLILDLAPFLRSGPNTVICNAIPGRGGAGGPLRLFVGTGRNEAGTVVLDDPTISVMRRAEDATRSFSRTWTLDVR